MTINIEDPNCEWVTGTHHLDRMRRLQAMPRIDKSQYPFLDDVCDGDQMETRYQVRDSDVIVELNFIGGFEFRLLDALGGVLPALTRAAAEHFNMYPINADTCRSLASWVRAQ